MFTRFLNGLEIKFGHLAIPNLLRVVAAFNGLVLILLMIYGNTPGFYEALTLDREKILQGEVWRLITFALIPRTMNPILIIFVLMIVILCGDALESAWGSFKVNVYYFTGLIATIIGAMIAGSGTAEYLNASILFAFATLFPLYEFRIYFILPVQVRWLALIQALVYVGLFAIGGPGTKIAIVISFVNYFLFFGPAFVSYLRTRQEVAHRRARYEMDSIPEDEPLHRCKTCRATENSDPELEFRVASDGEEYCENHLPGKAG